MKYLDELRFINSVRVVQDAVVANSIAKKNYPETPQLAIQQLREEISELEEEVNKAGDKRAISAETADCLLTLLILASKLEIDLPFYALSKHKYNLTRPEGHKVP